MEKCRRLRGAVPRPARYGGRVTELSPGREAGFANVQAAGSFLSYRPGDPLSERPAASTRLRRISTAKPLMPRVLITDNLAPVGRDVLEAADGIEVDIRDGINTEDTREQLKAALADADGIIIRSATKLRPDVLEGQTRLKAIVRAGVGTDNIDKDAATRAGIVVMNTPGGNTISTAEHTIAMMLAMSRNIAPAAQSMREGRWDRKKYTGSQVAGKTIAIVGLGRIGQEVAKRCKAREMKLIGFDPIMSKDHAAGMGITLYRDVDELVTECDYLTVHTPLNDHTRDLINAERLAKMKRGARLINCARGGIINESDLADAIESGHIGGAALDVFTSEPPTDRRLVELPQVLSVPHLGASTEEAQEQVAQEAAEIMVGFLLKGDIRHPVNMASVSAEEMATVKPYLDLAYRLGRLAGQLPHDPVGKVQVQYRGDVAESSSTGLITSALTAGMLEGAIEGGVEIISASMLAKERGIEIIESKSSETGNFATLIAVSISGVGDRAIHLAGTMFGESFPRLVRVDDFQLDAYLDGTMMIYRHQDVPGLIGRVGTVLGESNVNISHMAVGRKSNEPGGDAIGVLNLDSRPDASVVNAIAALDAVQSVQIIDLPTAGKSLPFFGG